MTARHATIRHGVPSFCRHNRLIQNCPICSREQQIELRPVVSPRPESGSSPRPAGGAGRGGTSVGAARKTTPGAGRTSSGAGVRVRRLRRGAEDGYQSPVLPGLKSSADAERLAQEIAFAAFRLERLAGDPPGLFAEVASGEDLEERTWLAFQIAYLGPLEEEEDPFAAIEEVRTTWASGALPDLDGVRTGPRSAHEPERGASTLDSYRAWAARAGSQAEAFTGEGAWTPERRFERLFERLALPGLHRDARYDLLVTLGCTAVYDLSGAVLKFGGENKATLAAKRALGIGDPLLLERRALRSPRPAGSRSRLSTWRCTTGSPARDCGSDSSRTPSRNPNPSSGSPRRSDSDRRRAAGGSVRGPAYILRRQSVHESEPPCHCASSNRRTQSG